VARQLKKLPPEQRLVITSHRVRRGESLAGIARRYGAAVEAVAAVNALSGGKIRPNEVLAIPVEGSGTSIEDGLKLDRMRSEKPGGAKTHIVSRGETLWGISRRYGVTPSDLLRWNRRGTNTALRPGDRLVLTAGGG
jgi:membrane-bound lytic murein transglycosylase D